MHREDELAAAEAALRQAALLCQSVQQAVDISVVEKGDKSPVTVADLGSQAVICKALKTHLPGCSIVAEEDSSGLRRLDYWSVAAEVTEHVRRAGLEPEKGQVLRWIDYGTDEPGGDSFWTLDPVDGTKGFLRGAQYAIALALIVNGQPEIAALACPNLDGGQLYLAERGKGATRHSLTADAAPQRVSVIGTDVPSKARFCESVESAHSAHGDAQRVANHLGITERSVRMDSQAKYAVVAGGQAEIYLRLPTSKGYREKIWDHAAGALILEEAGGKATDITGKPLDFSQGRTLSQNAGVVATNGVLHAQVVGAIRALDIA